MGWFLVFVFKLDRALVAQFRVSSLSIIEHFDVFKNRAHRLLARPILFSLNQLLFQGAEKAFGGRVVPAVSTATHTHNSISALENLLILATRILTALIAVMHPPCFRTTAFNGLFQSPHREVRFQRFAA